jgi:hypothetical protein
MGDSQAGSWRGPGSGSAPPSRSAALSRSPQLRSGRPRRRAARSRRSTPVTYGASVWACQLHVSRASADAASARPTRRAPLRAARISAARCLASAPRAWPATTCAEGDGAEATGGRRGSSAGAQSCSTVQSCSGGERSGAEWTSLRPATREPWVQGGPSAGHELAQADCEGEHEAQGAHEGPCAHLHRSGAGGQGEHVEGAGCEQCPGHGGGVTHARSLPIRTCPCNAPRPAACGVAHPGGSLTKPGHVRM